MFIVKKNINGKEYYYLRKSRRVNGRVRAVTLAYLGKTRKGAEEKAKIISKNISNVKKENRKGLKNEGNKERNKGDKTIKMEKSAKKVMKDGEKEFFSFVQEAGLIWGPSPEIYGGLAGFYTYGPLGKLLKNKVENSVRSVFNSKNFRELEGPTVLPDVVWEASGHLNTFKDRVIKCKKCEKIFRVDKLIEEEFDVPADSFSDDKALRFIEEKGIVCPSCKGHFDMKVETESLMMGTNVSGQAAHLRPETATVTYLPFLRLYNYFRKKSGFAVYQIGKAYRDEISPRQHVLRGREFTQAEAQVFVDPLSKNDWEAFEEIKEDKLPFWSWEQQDKEESFSKISIQDALSKGLIKSQAYGWCIWLAYNQFLGFGIPKDRIRLRQHHPDEKAFYADDAWDIEVKLNNYGWTELCGVHDRTDYDLKQHSKASGVNLEAVRENGEKFIPHILEIAFGIDRPVYALIDIFYSKKEEGSGKTIFRVPYQMAPIEVSIFPLMKKPELLQVAQKIKEDLEREFVVDYDISGSIGRRYLRSASAGTPYALTIDYDSLENSDVTIRDRDSEKQKRIKIKELREIIRKLNSREIEFEDLN